VEESVEERDSLVVVRAFLDLINANASQIRTKAEIMDKKLNV
jgi:hypothetical protein